MPSGGRRTAKAGAVYPHRSDLTADAEYGDRINREAVRSATPNNVTPIRPAAGIKPGQLTPLTAPTERPDEPVTAGLPIGPGPGPESLSPMPVYDDGLFDLRALAAQYPYQDFLRIIANAEREK